MKNVKERKSLFAASAAVITIVMVMSLGLIGCGSTENPGTEGTDEEPAPGVFENMKTVDFEGNEVDSTVFAENELTVVNIWATWCSPCVGEVAILDQLNREYEGTGVAVKGLIFEDFGHEDGLSANTRAAVDRLLTKTGAEYQQLLLSIEMLGKKEIQSVEALPTTLFVDAGGKIIGSVVGARDYDGWKEIIEEYRAKVSDLR